MGAWPFIYLPVSIELEEFCQGENGLFTKFNKNHLAIYFGSDKL
jgi:hypothetical protein